MSYNQKNSNLQNKILYKFKIAKFKRKTLHLNLNQPCESTGKYLRTHYYR